uniref:Uncharacterized protein n=1 Tax=Arundo donax TaxID=35708 RepID=A0A0A8YR77_ARUDO
MSPSTTSRRRPR